jgi:hypothetical protein
MKQKSHVISLFRLQLTISYTREGCLGPKKDYFGQKWAIFISKMWIWGSKRTFFGVYKRFETNRVFPGPKMDIHSKFGFHNETKSIKKGRHW